MTNYSLKLLTVFLSLVEISRSGLLNRRDSSVLQNRSRFENKEIEIAKAIIRNAIVTSNDTVFERQTKDLVSNFLVNAAVEDQRAEVIDDYDEIYYYATTKPTIATTTEDPASYTWATEDPLISPEESQTIPTVAPPEQDFYDTLDTSSPPEISDTNTTETANVTETDLTLEEGNGTEIDVNGTMGKKPGVLFGAIQQASMIIPDGIKPGNNASVLNGKNVGNILKILGSVAFLNLSGIIDNSIELGTSTAVKGIVFGVTNLVFCNPVVKSLNEGRCTRKLYDGERFGEVLRF